MNILAIDDNPDVLQFLANSLSPLYCIKTCPSVKDAGQVLKTFHPNLMILDIVMNEIDGQVFAELVNELHPEIKILLITGHHDFSAHAIGYTFPIVYKPILKKTLLAEVEKLLR